MADRPGTGTGHGFGRVLVFVYGIFALAATGRSTLQLATEASKAPLPYALSAVAAVVYIVATFALATDRRRLALAAVGIELVGVLVVGVTSTAAARGLPGRDSLVGLRRRLRLRPARAAVRRPVVAAARNARRTQMSPVDPKAGGTRRGVCQFFGMVRYLGLGEPRPVTWSHPFTFSEESWLKVRTE